MVGDLPGPDMAALAIAQSPYFASGVPQRFGAHVEPAEHGIPFTRPTLDDWLRHTLSRVASAVRAIERDDLEPSLRHQAHHAPCRCPLIHHPGARYEAAVRPSLELSCVLRAVRQAVANATDRQEWQESAIHNGHCRH